MRSLDYYRRDEQLTEEQRRVRRTVRSWVEDRVRPIIAECFEHARFPDELIGEMAELGLFGANIDGYGCAGLDEIAYGLMMQELERGDSGLRSMASVQGALVMYPIHAFGTEQQRTHFLPKLAQGELVGCFGLTEPGHGSDPSGMETTAAWDGDAYVLHGTKTWITNASIADVAIVWAKTDDTIRGFIVDCEDAGVATSAIHGKLSMRASHTGEIYLDGCRVPPERVLPEADGLRAPLMCLNQARYGIAWGTVGAAMACFEEARQYAMEREQFGRSIASFQLVQAKLVDMATAITRAQLMCHRLGELKEAGQARHTQISLAKRDHCRMALDVARSSRDLLGGNGITLDYQSIRHMANLETVATYEGTDHIHTLIVGQDLTGVSAFR